MWEQILSSLLRCFIEDSIFVPVLLFGGVRISFIKTIICFVYGMQLLTQLYFPGFLEKGEKKKEKWKEGRKMER